MADKSFATLQSSLLGGEAAFHKANHLWLNGETDAPYVGLSSVWLGQVAKWLWRALLAIAVLLLLVCLYFYAWNSSLTERTEARVTSADQASRTLTYEFEADGETFSATQVSGRRWSQSWTKEDTTMPVIYFPMMPSMSSIKSEVESFGLFEVLLFPGFAFGLAYAAYALFKDQRHAARLFKSASHVVPATITQVPTIAGGIKAVGYEFTSPKTGAPIRSASMIASRVVEAQNVSEGSRVALLYADDAHHQLL